MMSIRAVLLAALVLGLADAQTCKWSGCRQTGPNCIDEFWGNTLAYSTGRTTRSGWAGDWNFCGWAWERKYECCWSPRPTNYPTPKPTAYPTPPPTLYPTYKPTLKPTVFPSSSPVTPAPSINPTVSPTPPTPFPTKAPTIPVPSASPTTQVDQCGFEDLDNFAENSRNFDKDMAVCGVYCSLDVLRDKEEIINCMGACHSDPRGQRRPTLRMPPMEPPCAACMGVYADCVVSVCECPAGRASAQKCTECSQSTCEQPFTICTGGMVIPEYDGSFPEPEAESSTLMVAALGAFGGLVALSGAAGLFVYKRRQMDPNRVSSVRLSTYLGKSPIGRATSDKNPLFKGADAVPVAAALGGAVTAAAAATVAAAAIAQSGAKLTVVHAFVGNPDFEDELTVEKGAKLEFVGMMGDDESWMSCIDPATGKEGIIPTVNVQFDAQT